MMRVLVVTTWFPDQEHPSRTPFCLEHVKAVMSTGAQVEVLHVDLSGKAAETSDIYEGVTVHRVRLNPLRPLAWARVWRRTRTRLACADVLHTMAFSSILVALPPWFTRSRPWVHTEHWNGVVAPRSIGRAWPLIAILRHLLRFPHVVTGVTAQLAGAMAPYARADATEVIPCVVSSDAPVLPYPSSPPTRLVAVGLLNHRKNPLLALDVIDELRTRGHDIRFTWVGDGPLRGQVERRAAELDLDGIVKFTGAVQPQAVRGYLDAADLFFLPSSQENFFTALAESIVAGRPGVVPLSGGFDAYCTWENAVMTSSWEVGTLADGVEEAIERFQTIPPTQVADSVADRFSNRLVGELFARAFERAGQRRNR